MSEKIHDSVIWWPLALGLGIGLFFTLPFDPAWWAGPLACAAMLPFCFLPAYPWHRVPLLLLIACIGFALAQLRVYEMDAPRWTHSDRAVDMTATILEVTPMPVGTRLLLGDVKTGKGDLKKARLVCKSCAPGDPAVGSKIAARGSLTPPAGPAREGGFDFRRIAFFRQIGAVGFTYGKPDIVTPPTTTGQNPFAAARQKLAAQTEAATTDKDAAALAVALLTGVSTGLSEPLREAYQASGLAHIYSVSGLHLSFVAGFLFYLFRGIFALTPLALRFPTKKIAALMALAAVILFTLFAGDSVPTWRSLLMTAIVLLAVMTDRFAFTLRTVALAACVILALMPEMLLDVSFQLSFAAVTALVAWMEWIHRPRVQTGVPLWWPVRAARDVLTTSLLASFATLPFILFSFGRLSVWGPIANMVGVPWTGFVLMPLVLLTLILFPLGAASWGLALLLPVCAILNNWAETVAGWAGSDWRVATIPPLVLLCCALSLYVACAHPRRWSFGVLLASYIALIVCVLLPPMPPPGLYVSANGLVAWRHGSEVWVSSKTKDKFVRTQWLNEWGLNDDAIKVLPREGPIGTNGYCDRSACRMMLEGGGAIRILRSAVAATEACRSGEYAIAPTINLPGHCNHAVDRQDLKRFGVHVLRDGNLRPLGDAAADRIWARQGGYHAQ